MIKLKAGVLVTPHNEGMSFHKGKEVISVTERKTKFYLKSEADKVISDKDDVIEELKIKLKVQTSITEDAWKLKDAYHTDYAEAVKELYEKNKELRRQKYKRCLAMAKWCENEEARLKAIAPLFDTDKECWEYNSDYWNKWRKRWLELAEKFKEGV